MSLAFIALGSNIGEGLENIVKAWQLLGENNDITLLALSAPYMSKPVIKSEWLKTGRDVSEHWFTNAVGAVETSLAPQSLLETTAAIEINLGRDRTSTVNRAIDLDLIYYDDLILSDETLTLPHPEMHKRHFVLVPLAEIAPDRIHPVNGLTTSNMLRALPFAGKDEIFREKWDTEDAK